ncbi:unnamed protein product [Didymodactylos carnosus]|uniref:Neurotransmitter-gated ion-channel ligand-binding domain-containing protein n=1 Tax=Didymodactylos carnosus TaxID=1234261 RepID=A0A814J4K3_9BILA|nr:unnamed protein product [Didymodactylos carnosus]CAF1033253.1 unnamed protein product [Didymodactylos carnosus]CAF3631553.1 unnamed protein product [Didymodactylos carnosus]CAF3804000.1 unnamed protein product [Didymodactylos carnosus]
MHLFVLYLCLLICVTYVQCEPSEAASNCTGYYNCKILLYDQLIKQSRSSLRPVKNELEKINVSIEFSFVRLISVNEEDSLLQIHARINQTWNASLLSWNPLNYFNVTGIHVPAHLVWTPKISLVNQHSAVDNEENNFIFVQSIGRFEFNYLAILTIPCDFDLQRFPFDQQICSFKLGSFVYDSSAVSITQADDFILDESNLTPSEYTFASHKVVKQDVWYPGSGAIYDMIVIQLDIDRQSSYFIHLINWPGFLLALLSLAIFLLPAQANERIIFGTLLVLGQLLLFSIFARYIPKRLASNWGWMGRTIFYDMIITALAIVFSLIVRFLSDKHYCYQRPSLKTRTFVFGWLTKLVGLKRSSYATLIANRENEYESNEYNNNNNNNNNTTDSLMEPLNPILTVSDQSDVISSISNDLNTRSMSSMLQHVAAIRHKFSQLVKERDIHNEWLLLAHIINRVFFFAYLFLFLFSIIHHCFYH